MRYRFYTTSEKAWGAMLAAIETAEESIYLEMYIFDTDTLGYDFLSTLERKAREGVRVIMILDILGSFGLKAATVDRLRIAGVEVCFFSYWFRRTHRKLLIIDEKTAFIGGVNIAHRFAKWRDLQMRVTGKIVEPMVRSFARAYRECGGKNPALENHTHLPLMKKARMWFIEHGIGNKYTALRAHYETHIQNATNSITLVTPYLIPHRWLIAELHQAIMRGVVVILIVPERTDYKFADHAHRYYFQLFSKLGAQCYFGKEMNHAKVMLIDDREGTVGSQNLDGLSFNWNSESGIFFNTPIMVRDLRNIIDEWKKEATPFDAHTYIRHWYDRILTTLAQLLQPIL